MSKDDGAVLAAVGTWVKVKELGTGDEELYQIVESRETDYLENKLPPDNPMSRALLEAQPGEEAAIDGPHGPVRFSVLEKGRHEP